VNNTHLFFLSVQISFAVVAYRYYFQLWNYALWNSTAIAFNWHYHHDNTTRAPNSLPCSNAVFQAQACLHLAAALCITKWVWNVWECHTYVNGWSEGTRSRHWTFITKCL